VIAQHSTARPPGLLVGTLDINQNLKNLESIAKTIFSFTYVIRLIIYILSLSGEGGTKVSKDPVYKSILHKKIKQLYQQWYMTLMNMGFLNESIKSRQKA